jgi:hypothetical protein
MKQIVKKYMDCDNRKTTAILYKTLTISMIQLELAVVFLLSQSMYFLTICFMYVPYLLFNYEIVYKKEMKKKQTNKKHD